MLDRRFIVQHVDEIRDNNKVRNVTVDLDRFVELEAQRRELATSIEDLNRDINANAKLAGRAGEDERAELREAGVRLKTERAKLEAALPALEDELLELQQAIPNLTHPAAPIGLTDADNREIGSGATPIRELGFEPKDHVDLGLALGLLDLEGGARVAGHGFYFLVGDLVLLDMALQRHAIAVLAEAGYSTMVTPDVARAELLTATGYSPRGSESQIYSLEGTDLGLIATAEITLAGIHQGQLLDEADLPIRLGGLSHCFRTEAGAHGRATRGIYRVHQFSKVEMFAVAHPDQSAAIHDEMLGVEKQIFDQLGIPYRIVENATGDLGAAAYRKFDIEAWMPGRGGYGEVTSTSNCTDYQSRRLNLRYRATATGRSAGLAHTLNGTAVATSRALVAVMENYQQEDGSIEVPAVLRPFVGKDRLD
jgi:seryl-tRNA synthetase